MLSLSPIAEIILILVMSAAEFLLCALPAVLWVVIGRQNWVEAFSWRRPAGRELLGAALMGLGLIPWVQTIMVCQNHLWPGVIASQRAQSAALLPLLRHHPWLLTFSLPLSAAFSEELFFRGPLQRACVRRLPVWPAIGLTSLVFAAAHFDWPGLVVRTLLGALLAVLVLRGRSIFPAMTLHFVYDAAALGGSAWDVHQMGLGAALRLAGQAGMGVSRAELVIGPLLGTLLLLAGWGLCVSAWRRKKEGPKEALGA